MIYYSEEKKELIIPTGLGNLAAITEAQAEANFESGYTVGKADGIEVGYGIGWDDGHESGYTEGYADGYASGFTEGYADGYRSATTVPVELVLVYNFDEEAMHPLSCINIQINGINVEYEYDSGAHLYWAYAHLQVAEYDIESINSITIDFTSVPPEESANPKTFKTITIDGTDATILGYTINYLGEGNDYRIRYEIEPVDITMYGKGFEDGWNSAMTKTIELALLENDYLFAYMHNMRMFINGVETPILGHSEWFQGHPSYIKLSGQTQDTVISSIEYITHVGGALPEEWDIIEINGVPTTVVQSCEKTGSDYDEYYHYTFTFDNAPVYDKASYEAGLAACQNNENQ